MKSITSRRTTCKMTLHGTSFDSKAPSAANDVVDCNEDRSFLTDESEFHQYIWRRCAENVVFWNASNGVGGSVMVRGVSATSSDSPVHLELTHYCSELQRSCSETSSYPLFHVHPVLILQQDNACLHTAGVCMQILQHSHINIMQCPLIWHLLNTWDEIRR